MKRRQTDPNQWLIVQDRADLRALRRLTLGSGLLLLGPPATLLQLRLFALSRRLSIVAEAPRTAVRVHNLPELRRALLNRVPMILLSPIFATKSHPEWRPIPRMRAAAFARLGRRQLVALGGMNRRRYAMVAPLGFTGWAGISAFRT